MVSPLGGGLHALPVVLQRVVVVVESYGPHKVRDRLSLALREPYALFSMPTVLEFQSYPQFKPRTTDAQRENSLPLPNF